MIIGSTISCFDGLCDPWSKTCCSSCSIRPMKIYIGNDQSIQTRQLARAKGLGCMVSGQYRGTVSEIPYFALDNEAFAAWKNNRPWDGDKFLKIFNRFISRGLHPDFVVVPDIVAGGRESLSFSREWLKKLPQIDKVRRYLAVQDGMNVKEVAKEIKLYGGIFIGGSIDWKLETGASWVELAHKFRKPCHIGRIGPLDRILWAYEIGADSIDSTYWSQNEKGRSHLLQAIGGI